MVILIIPIDFFSDDVYKLLSSLDTSSSMGPDGIHPYLLNKCAINLTYPLFLIFRKSLSTASLPLAWKRSLIIPIFKKGTRQDPLNYRPISLTSVSCKMFEKLIVNQLNVYLDNNSLICNQQFGFRKNRSVEDQLLLTYNDITSWLDSGYFCDLILFGFMKAFDVVNHQILLTKLSSIGIGHPLLGWIADFLTNRTTQVAVSSSCSSPTTVLSGVPQGSVLGPILFLIFINFVPNGVHSRFMIFADDLKIFLSVQKSSISSILTDLNIAQQDINHVVSTAQSWGLSLNTSKSAVIRFQRGNFDWKLLGPYSDYYIGNSKIKFVNSHSDLGITIDSSLRFHAHINTIVCKANGLASNLLRSTINRSPSFMIPVYKTHIRPILEVRGHRKTSKFFLSNLDVIQQFIESLKLQ